MDWLGFTLGLPVAVALAVAALGFGLFILGSAPILFLRILGRPAPPLKQAMGWGFFVALGLGFVWVAVGDRPGCGGGGNRLYCEEADPLE